MSLLWHRGWVGKEKVDMPTNKQTPDLVCGANCRERKDESCVESRPNNFMNEERTKYGKYQIREEESYCCTVFSAHCVQYTLLPFS